MSETEEVAAVALDHDELRAIVEGTAHGTGAAFFESLAKHPKPMWRSASIAGYKAFAAALSRDSRRDPRMG